jgi:hypothetical protein
MFVESRTGGDDRADAMCWLRRAKGFEAATPLDRRRVVSCITFRRVLEGMG